ncbi:beta-1,4-glucuronyltransferase 1 [Microplitis demolitor]|uniref:beta-1,4-glucuronyltransferase 1 n=1 Tax=Microplitis demolitor TaxID=69319 RepID=UPI0004400010|nr:beta-1,4-glucuronyltransferase 1 [Microplitis demolitor]
MRGYPRRLIFVVGIALFLLLSTRLLIGRSLVLPLDDDAASSFSPRGPDNFIQEPSRGFARAYAPGMYMRGQQPLNNCACAWKYELPFLFSYPVNEIRYTPQAGEDGPYRVLPFVIRSSVESDGSKPFARLTLCTHATADLVYNVVELVKRWEGPVSLAVFTPGRDAELAVRLLDRACRCEPQMHKLSVHLIFPANLQPIIKNNYLAEDGDCSALDLHWQLQESLTDRKDRGLTYPINVARNVAKSLAMTSRVLVSDIELLPSDKLASGFLKMIDGQPPRKGLAFVVPVFEIEETQQPPKNKRELMAAINKDLAVYFHKYMCIHCQRFPGITKWMLRPDPGRVKPLIVTRREYPHHRWEPVYIGTQDDPLYNENMTWEGRQEKMSQMLEMCLMNYQLIILDGAFLVHTPGIKRKTYQLNPSKSTFERTQEMLNAQIYQSITHNLLNQYPINRKCRQ